MIHQIEFCSFIFHPLIFPSSCPRGLIVNLVGKQNQVIVMEISAVEDLI